MSHVQHVALVVGMAALVPGTLLGTALQLALGKVSPPALGMAWPEAALGRVLQGLSGVVLGKALL